MTHVIAIVAFAVLCGLWVLIQVSSGRQPRACKGDAGCERGRAGDCSRSCAGENPEETA